MRILVITSDSRWVNAVRAVFPGEHDVMPADPRQLYSLRTLLPVIDACFVAETEAGPFTIDVVKNVSSAANVPLFAVADSLRPEWEEAVLMAGARQVFKAPLRAGIVQLAVSRAGRASLGSPQPAPLVAGAPMTYQAALPRENRELVLLRDFSRMLVHAAREPAFMAAYLGTLREIVGCSRVILYLLDSSTNSMVYRFAAATGVDARQFETFRVHLDHGLGRLVAVRGGVVLRERLRFEDPDNGAAAREMDVFGAVVALPLVTSQGCVGMALLGPRIAGSSYSDQEFTLLYHTLEEFAAAIAKPVPIEPAPVREKALFPEVLRAVPVGCALLNHALQVLDANEAFRVQLGAETANPIGMQRLPSAWSEAIGAIVQKGGTTLQIELDHELSGVRRRIRVSVQPFKTETAGERTWLMVTEDITDETRLRQELHDRSIHTVLQRAGEQLSNEFRNALTPIEILVQLSGESSGGRRDLDRLRAPVSLALHRLRRRIDNLAYLTSNSIVPELTTVSAVFRSARDRLDHWLEAKQLKTLVWSGEFSKVSFTADSAAVGLAIAELVMNAVEAAGGRQVTITAEDLPEALNFKVRNPGEWAPPSEGGGFGHRPFVTSKSSGVGLGVEVASRVAEFHGGRLALGPVSSDVVEAILRVPRNLPAVQPNLSTPIVSAA